MEVHALIENLVTISTLDIPIAVAIIMALSSILITFLPLSHNNSVWAKVYRIVYAILKLFTVNIGKRRNKKNKERKKNK